MPRGLTHLADPHALVCRAVLLVSFAAYLLLFLPLLPADGRGLGHDYSSVMPNLLAGYYWFLGNGPLATPWFTPAQCGGVPYFADPVVGYRTVPQWLAFVVDPLTAVRVTFVLFAAAGMVGCYRLLCDRFEVSRAAAAGGAVLLLYSAFFTYRMAIGHVAFHPYTLTPLLAWAALAPRPEATGRIAAACLAAWPVVLGGLVIAYMFQAGMVHVVPCAVLAAAVIVLLHGHRRGHRLRPWVLLGAACLAGSALGASRVNAILSFLGNFPRTDYPLPGMPDVRDLLRIAAGLLFWRVYEEDTANTIIGLRFRMEQPEWEYGPGPAALVVLLAGAAVAAVRLVRNPPDRGRVARSAPALIAIAAILLLPLLLNWYEPRWNSLLKSLPYFGSSSNLFRWFSIYVPVTAVLAALALERAAPGRWTGAGALVLAAGATIAWSAGGNRLYYVDQQYDSAAIVRAWRAAGSGGGVPAISRIDVLRTRSGEGFLALNGNDLLTRGASQFMCYAPVFGYRLERFPAGPMRSGPALGSPSPGILNVKNPACYLFPRENDCRPGDHFTVGQREHAARFLAYRPFPFVLSARQRAADLTAKAALVLAALIAAGALYGTLRRGDARAD